MQYQKTTLIPFMLLLFFIVLCYFYVKLCLQTASFVLTKNKKLFFGWTKKKDSLVNNSETEALGNVFFRLYSYQKC